MADAALRVSDEDLQLVYSSSVRLWGRLPVSRLAEEISDANDKIKALEAERDEARANAERFRNSMYAVEEQSLRNLQRAERAEAALAKDARVETILAAVPTPSGDPEHGTRDHLPRVLRDYLAEACGAAHKTGFDDGYAEGAAKFKDDLTRAEAALERVGELAKMQRASLNKRIGNQLVSMNFALGASAILEAFETVLAARDKPEAEQSEAEG